MKLSQMSHQYALNLIFDKFSQLEFWGTDLERSYDQLKGAGHFSYDGRPHGKRSI